MADLATLRPEDTYGGLLQAPGGVGGSPVALQSGAGVSLPVTVSTTTIAFTGTVNFTAATVVGLAGGGTPAGSDTQVQFNDGGAFGGDTGLLYDKTNNILKLVAAGGTAGTDEVRVKHTGSRAEVEVKDGGLRLIAPNGVNYFEVYDANGNFMFEVNGASGCKVRGDFIAGNSDEVFITTSAGRAIARGGYDFRHPSTSTIDAGLQRAAAGVVGLETNGGAVGHTLRSTPLTPAQLTADQNDYAPGVARFYRLSTDATRSVTGLNASQVSGQECEVWNVGANSLVLKHQDAGSAAANRFLCTGGADVTLAADDVALLRYDATTSRWRVRKV